MCYLLFFIYSSIDYFCCQEEVFTKKSFYFSVNQFYQGLICVKIIRTIEDTSLLVTGRYAILYMSYFDKESKIQAKICANTLTRIIRIRILSNIVSPFPPILLQFGYGADRRGLYRDFIIWLSDCLLYVRGFFVMVLRLGCHSKESLFLFCEMYLLDCRYVVTYYSWFVV